MIVNFFSYMKIKKGSILVQLTVFNTHDYSDNGSGSVVEALFTPATDSYVELEVSSFYSTDHIRSVSVAKRKCIFADELPVLYADYTYSDCLVDCRAAVIWDTCNCRPFYLPRRGNDQCMLAYISIYTRIALIATACNDGHQSLLNVNKKEVHK